MLGSAFQKTGGLPPFLTAQLVFPYQTSLAFVQRLYRAAGNRWTLVDAAHRSHPPVSTEQIMHPDAYLRFENPVPVRLRVNKVLGDGWQRVVAGTLGEFETREVLANGGGGAADAAAGWGGDRYELWRRAPLAGTCSAPCIDDDALVVRWRWDTRKDEREFLASLRQWVREGSRPHGGGVAVRRSGGAVTLVIASDGELADRLVNRS